MRVSIEFLVSADAALFENIAPEVFDDPIDIEATHVFLADPNHFIVGALDDEQDGQVSGFVSATKTFHPDKLAPELWINEVGVAASHQGGASARK